MTIDDDDQFSVSHFQGSIAAGTGPSPWVVHEMQIGITLLQCLDAITSIISRFAVGNDHLEAIRVVVLFEQVTERGANGPLLVANRDKNRDERSFRGCGGFPLERTDEMRRRQLGGQVLPVAKHEKPSVASSIEVQAAHLRKG